MKTLRYFKVTSDFGFGSCTPNLVVHVIVRCKLVHEINLKGAHKQATVLDATRCSVIGIPPAANGLEITHARRRSIKKLTDLSN